MTIPTTVISVVRNSYIVAVAVVSVWDAVARTAVV